MAKTNTRWKKGQSGNPAGRPKGSGKSAQLRALLEPHAKELVKKAKDMALAGDSTAMRLCLERLIPVAKENGQPVQIDGLKGADSLTRQGQAVLDALSSGDITPRDAASIMQSLATQARIVEVDELERRVTELECRGVA